MFNIIDKKGLKGCPSKGKAHAQCLHTATIESNVAIVGKGMPVAGGVRTEVRWRITSAHIHILSITAKEGAEDKNVHI